MLNMNEMIKRGEKNGMPDDNFTKLFTMNRHSISTIFCGLVDGCAHCKMAKRCRVGGNGFLDWMNDVNGFSEITEEQEDHEND